MPGSFQDAEDALQDTLLTAWQGLGGFEGRASLRSWLYRIATNRCLNAFRSASRRPAREWNIPEVEPPEPTRPGDVVWLEPFSPTPSSRCDQRAVGKPSVPEEPTPHHPSPRLSSAPSQPPSGRYYLGQIQRPGLP